jgi:hypothetical protein
MKSYLFISFWLILIISLPIDNKENIKNVDISFKSNLTKPSQEKKTEVQLNRVPHPFSINGSFGFVVWVDGQRLNLNSLQLKELTDFLEINYERPKDTQEIHGGEGWLVPLNVGTTFSE